MDTSKEVQRYMDLCHRYVVVGKAVRITVVIACLVSFLGGITGIIISVIKNNFSSIYLFGPVSLFIPIVLMVGYFIWLATADLKRRDKFVSSLYNSDLSAEEVLIIGKKEDLDLFSIALDIRCRKELKLNGVPEWCARDGVLPNMKE